MNGVLYLIKPAWKADKALNVETVVDLRVDAIGC